MLHRYENLSQSLPPQPRIAALLSCGQNLMALSWHMPISREPFRYAIAMRKTNFTFTLLQENKSFALHFLPFEYHRSIDLCGRVHGNDIDKLSLTGLGTSSLDSNGNILLNQADCIYECTLIDTYENGDHTIFIADVDALYLNEEFKGDTTLFVGRGQYTTANSPSVVPRHS